jgi:excisionase family DNA binding protein
MCLEGAMKQDVLMTVKEVARYLHVVQLTVYRMIDRGDLPAVKVGSRWRIRRQDLEDYLKRSTSQPKEPKP